MLSPFGFLDRPTAAPVLVDGAAKRIWTQDEVAAAVDSFSDRLRGAGRELIFCLCGRDVASVIGYLSAVRAGHAVALLAADAPAHLTDALIERYRPAFVLVPDGDRPFPAVRTRSPRITPAVSDELAVLL